MESKERVTAVLWKRAGYGEFITADRAAEIVLSYNCSFLNYSAMISEQEEVEAVAVGLERRTALIIFRFRRVIGHERCGFYALGFYCVWRNGSGQQEMENQRWTK